MAQAGLQPNIQHPSPAAVSPQACLLKQAPAFVMGCGIQLDLGRSLRGWGDLSGVPQVTLTAPSLLLCICLAE